MSLHLSKRLYAYIGVRKIEDGCHFHGNEPQEKNIDVFFILILFHTGYNKIQLNEWVENELNNFKTISESAFELEHSSTCQT